MLKSRSVVALLAGLALLAGSPALLAQSDKGKEQHPQQMRVQHEDKGGSARTGNAPHRQYPQDDRERMEQRSQVQERDAHRRDERRNDRYRESFRVDHEHVRLVVHDGRGYWRPGPALPPGIRKNLQRGKPLPPGIDKHWLDGRLERQLPRYQGHEWIRVGNDLVLMSVTTRLINDVLYDIFN